MNNQTVSTAAFIGAGLAIVLYIFKVIPVKHALLAGAALGGLGLITQPPIQTTFA